MGVVSMVMDHRAADDDVGQLTQDIEKNSRCRTYTPHGGTHRSIGGKDDGVVPTISMRSAEEISFLTPNPTIMAVSSMTSAS
jgi:hypothetical protein